MALLPAPIVAFLVSTKLPIFTPSSAFVPGRSRAYGPMIQQAPRTVPSIYENDLIMLPSPITVPAPITTCGSMMTSRPKLISALQKNGFGRSHCYALVHCAIAKAVLQDGLDVG